MFVFWSNSQCLDYGVVDMTQLHKGFASDGVPGFSVGLRPFGWFHLLRHSIGPFLRHGTGGVWTGF